MSELFIIDASENPVSFNQLNSTSILITEMAIKEGFGVCFNSFDYASNLLKRGTYRRARFHMVLSDSFVHRNCCELLDLSFLDPSKDYTSNFDIFLKRFSFLENLLDILYHNGFSDCSVFIDGWGTAETIGDFSRIATTKKDLLAKLWNQIYENKDECGYCFPPTLARVNLK